MAANKNEFNKDLVLREQLALQRTIMANQTTFLSFLRTAMYFLIAGLSIRKLFEIEDNYVLEYFFYISAGLIFLLGVINYYIQRKKIERSKIHVGNYQIEYLKK